MQVTDELIDKLARLSMLNVSAEERERVREDLEKMIGFIDRLREVNVDGVEPLLHMSQAMNAFRSDEPGSMLEHDIALRSAAHQDGQYFLVPRVIKRSGEA